MFCIVFIVLYFIFRIFIIVFVSSFFYLLFIYHVVFIFIFILLCLFYFISIGPKTQVESGPKAHVVCPSLRPKQHTKAAQHSQASTRLDCRPYNRPDPARPSASGLTTSRPIGLLFLSKSHRPFSSALPHVRAHHPCEAACYHAHAACMATSQQLLPPLCQDAPSLPKPQHTSPPTCQHDSPRFRRT